MFKSKSFWTFFLLAVLSTLIVADGSYTPTASAQTGTDRKLLAYAEQISGDRFTVTTRTARGVRVFARTQPSPQTLNAIDGGFTELFQIARRHGYSRRLSYADYTVFVGRADRLKDSAGNYSPDVAVPAGQY